VFDICHPDDKYCNISAAKNTFLSSLGRVLGNDPAPDTGTDSETDKGSGSTDTGTEGSRSAGSTAGPGGPSSALGSPGRLANGRSQLLDDLGPDYGDARLAAAVQAAGQLPDRLAGLGADPQAPVDL